MHLTGEHLIPAPRERVWQALGDSLVLRDCLPAGTGLQAEADGMIIDHPGGRTTVRGSIREPHSTLGWKIDPAGPANQMVLVRLASRGAYTRLSYELALADPPGTEEPARSAALHGAIETGLQRLALVIAGPAEIGAQGLGGLTQAVTDPSRQPTARLVPGSAATAQFAAILTPRWLGGLGFLLVLLAVLGLI